MVRKKYVGHSYEEHVDGIKELNLVFHILKNKFKKNSRRFRILDMVHYSQYIT